MTKKCYFLMVCMTVMGIALTSCSHDAFDNEAVVEKQSNAFAANFVKKYGEIDPNQSWDFANMYPEVTLNAENSNARALTRTEANFDRTVGSMLVDEDVEAWVLQNLPKGKNNTVKGRAFTMTVKPNPFTIVPVFQGYARYYWQLWMHVEGVGDELVWSKGEDFQYRKPVEPGEPELPWVEAGTGIQGMKRSDGALEVMAPTFTYANLPADATMYFYLKVWADGSNDGYNKYLKYKDDPFNPQYQPYETTSLNQYMLDLQGCTKPKNLEEGNEVTIIGCEDMLNSSDMDYEDLVFMIYGNPVPPTKRVEEFVESTTKRYMMEDLGDDDDFDFNDVVVDLSNRKKVKYYYNSLTDTEPARVEETTMPQLCVIRAAGGILDFTLFIGDKAVWTKSDHFDKTQMLNTGRDGAINYNRKLDSFELTEEIVWDAANNNVKVSVETRGNSGQVQTIVFPRLGDAPKMIAFDKATEWKKEREEVPRGWWK